MNIIKCKKPWRHGMSAQHELFHANKYAAQVRPFFDGRWQLRPTRYGRSLGLVRSLTARSRAELVTVARDLIHRHQRAVLWSRAMLALRLAADPDSPEALAGWPTTEAGVRAHWRRLDGLLRSAYDV